MSKITTIQNTVKTIKVNKIGETFLHCIKRIFLRNCIICVLYVHLICILYYTVLYVTNPGSK